MRLLKNRVLGCVLLTCLLFVGSRQPSAAADADPQRFPLVPYPKKLTPHEGAFTLTKDTVIVVNTRIGQADANGAKILNKAISAVLGAPLPLRSSFELPRQNVIAFDGFGEYPMVAEACEGQGLSIPNDLPPEGYVLCIRADRILIGAKDRRGMVCAALTLKQLLMKQSGAVTLPCCDIVDYPSLSLRVCHIQVPALTVQGWNLFEWRAARKPEVYRDFRRMQDYMPIVEEMTRMALEHKLNGIQIHVSNVFRLKSCPAMALPQAAPLEDLAPVLRMIREHYAEPIPEISFFSHQEHFLAKARPDLMLIKLAEFPKKRVTQYEDFFYWEPIYDPNNAEVRSIVTGVLDEVVDLFKPRYLHIGHDECGALAFVPRKKNSDITALFSGSVCFLHDQLKKRGVRTIMWGDMLLGSRLFPSGAAHGDRQGAPTSAAIADIPKDVIMADWHYYPFARPYPGKGGPREDFPSSLYLSDKGFGVLGGVLGKLARTPKDLKRWQRNRAHNQRFSRYVAGLNPEKAPAKGTGLGMIATHWYLNPLWLDVLREDKAMSVQSAAEQFWNAGERRDPVCWRNW